MTVSCDLTQGIYCRQILIIILAFYLQKLNRGIEQVCLNRVLHIIQDLPCDTQGKDLTYSARYGGKILLVFGDMAYEQ